MNYAHPEVLVETTWVAEHLDDPRVRLVESNEDLLLYHTGHIPGAVKLDWLADLAETDRRELIDHERFAQVMATRGIRNNMTLVFYGDTFNWWATYAFWVCKLFGHGDARIMNGGRAKWLAEQRPLTRDTPQHTPECYVAPPRDDTRHRAQREQVRQRIGQPGVVLVDARTPEEYRGTAQPALERSGEQTLRQGHIPGAVNIPWSLLVNEDGIYKGRAAFEQIFHAHGVTPDREVISYCLVGVLNSHIWFVLHYLLGYPHVRNYDGSWSEWGNLVSVPIARGDA